ncbi:stage V sporulation protein T [Clostridium saccharobutylicum]|uniref:AbrB/MazE/SpoVT family DNA-binding domain-containing protein n=1 Tax=Clostridium saccharobutylicum TaxID=169679 RepID=UPI000983CABF|nr:AbrB/MazE/SpoVT family DNA-binding domain-containing protein [Clostridium saccharobutylicum]AQS08348.1 stage V sporulation protein T [Clostridium saccharobutylicum]MBC2438314.1 AbrB/MazE/SpoVT family DNA-binding domain-containing protein [Clostridium saccharobutylicum]NSB88288.1 transcriptional pleiotropic regulator of transition state genes [Clostridium saccharobutylicum]NYC29324.1 transcriptional pleiotropic regulator of transition state genes [Clostridium saccharobutylicum]OOM17843.1 sta
MKTSGIIRNVDPLGRVVIPKEMRKVMGINEGDPIEIVKVNNDIVMRKYSKGCIFCGSNKEIVEFNKALVCRKCKQALKED